MQGAQHPHPTRRGVLSAIGAGWALLALSGAAGAAGVGRFLMGTGRDDPYAHLKLGYPDSYELGVSMRHADCCVALVRTEAGFYALSVACSFDSGCIKYRAATAEFFC